MIEQKEGELAEQKLTVKKKHGQKQVAIAMVAVLTWWQCR